MPNESISHCGTALSELVTHRDGFAGDSSNSVQNGPAGAFPQCLHLHLLYHHWLPQEESSWSGPLKA